VPHLKAPIVAGAANNQLAEPRHGNDLHARGILYAPDYAINAGGLMSVSIELQGYNRERANRMVMGIYDNIGNIFALAKREGITSFRAADRLAEQRIAAIGKVKLPHVKQSADRLSGRMRAVKLG
jgi:leucine dehydrogenase